MIIFLKVLLTPNMVIKLIILYSVISKSYSNIIRDEFNSLSAIFLLIILQSIIYSEAPSAKQPPQITRNLESVKVHSGDPVKLSLGMDMSTNVCTVH